MILSMRNLILLMGLILSIGCQITIMTLHPGEGSSNSNPITMYNTSAPSNLNNTFNEYSSFFNCSLNVLYTYLQTRQQYRNNTPYQIIIETNGN